MTIDEYLKSEQAERDMAALLAGVPAMPATGCPSCVLMSGEKEAWQFIGVSHGGRHLDAYYRPDGEPRCPDCHQNPCTGAGSHWGIPEQRFVVSDLGEAVRALRLRTGQWDLGEREGWAIDDVIKSVAKVAPWGVDDHAIVSRYNDQGDYLAAPDLPRAIVRVLLAALLVAGMEV